MACLSPSFSGAIQRPLVMKMSNIPPCNIGPDNVGPEQGIQHPNIDPNKDSNHRQNTDDDENTNDNQPLYPLENPRQTNKRRKKRQITQKIRELYTQSTNNIPLSPHEIITTLGSGLANIDLTIPEGLLQKFQHLCEYVRTKGNNEEKNAILAIAWKLSLRNGIVFEKTSIWKDMITTAKQKGIEWLKNYQYPDPTISNPPTIQDIIAFLQEQNQNVQNALRHILTTKQANEEKIMNAITDLTKGNPTPFVNAVQELNNTRGVLELAIKQYTGAAQQIDTRMQNIILADTGYQGNLSGLWTQRTGYHEERKKHLPLIQESLTQYQTFRRRVFPSLANTDQGLAPIIQKALEGKSLTNDEQTILRNLGFSPPLLHPALPLIITIGQEIDMKRKYFHLYIGVLASNARLPQNSHNYIRETAMRLHDLCHHHKGKHTKNSSMDLTLIHYHLSKHAESRLTIKMHLIHKGLLSKKISISTGTPTSRPLSNDS
ncbi:MAG: hypothetical protein NZL83_03160 [Candidatus Absconditabacterales bacterium]|nr:hypothetical protein [Candidatus Absconditabacterales bacterium]